ncbi:MAG TPA: PilC/PilY family type IV pilus protein [Steroidobacteraceae bacterium]|nr:PilC/PilY family type IV pilus protein [Steroidobacteraceae bacterium]
MSKPKFQQWSALLSVALAILAAAPSAGAADLALTNTPLFLSPSVAPLNLLVLGRDHKLYYEAYNDHSDLNGDGVLDVGYKPARIDYYGYFDSYKCYTYSSSNNGSFVPAAVTANKQCVGQWSGDFLNYVTMTRIDALRKVLYGGRRQTDSATATVLERSHVPQDAHSWGKEYTGITQDGYDIRNYTPLALPASGMRHLFANTTVLNDANQLPRMRVLTDQAVRIWNWVSIERPVADTAIVTGVNVTTGAEIRGLVTPTDYTVRVSVCATGFLEANCRRYPGGNYKPTGLLQEFGENDAMYFGLLSGSYAKNTSGGVLRSAMASMTNEINVTTDGTFRAVDGIIRTLNRLKTTGFNNYAYDCGSAAAARPINDGDCQMWGNPIAEMMYEGLRYFAGRGAATPAFSITFGQGEESQLSGGGLPVAAWNNPYTNRPQCSKPFETVISDVNNSYDTDQLPGVDPSFGGGLTNDLPGPGLNVSTLGQTIWNAEIGASGSYFIGQVGATTDGAPTAKTVSSFGNIRGLSPEEPTKRGGYYAASVANYGLVNDISTSAAGAQNVSTFSVALASPLPKIEIPIAASGRKVTLAPFAKTVGGAFGISAATGSFQPTNQIVDFYVDTLTPTSGRFRVNFEDVEQGNDHDMDAIVVYDYALNADGTVTISLDSQYAAGSAIHHLGFVISGTTEDGIYLPVRDRDTLAASDPNYFLDTPNVAGALPLTWSKTFTAGSASGAGTLKDPLWYAAKWGGFKDGNANGRPDVTSEWDTNNDGNPDNYFLVTNALTLSTQLRAAFEEIIARTTSASSASVNSGSISSTTRVYQARFNTRDWTGQLLAFGVNQATGAVNTSPLWDASLQLPDANTRKIITVNSDGTPVKFRWADLDATRRTQLDAVQATQQVYVDYLRGDPTQEGGSSTYRLRVRPSKLGDIVSSSPLFVGPPRSRYSDSLEAAPYSAFVAAQRNRQEMVYAGANDGMLHGFSADTGREVFAFIPKSVFPNLNQLPRTTYSHTYYVDGAPNSSDVFVNGAWRTMLVGGLRQGGQGIYALDITNPSSLAAAEAAPGNVFKWEFTDQNDADLGFTYSQPAIVRLKNGTWAAVFGNGYNNTAADGRPSTTGNAVLYVVNMANGSLIKKFDTGFGSTRDPEGSARPNGLATPVMVDVDGDRIVDQAYVGDLFGNMWKIDLRSANPSAWDFAFRDASNRPQPLFEARDANGNAQPITVRPEVTRGPYGAGVMVVFGTGKYLEANDKLMTPVRVQSFYGLIDNNTFTAADRIAARNLLTTQTITSEPSIDPDGAGGNPPIKIRLTSNNALAGRGWVMDLLSPSGYQAEKQVTDPAIRGDRVIFTTLIPNTDPCGFGGSSWLMELDVLSGQRLRDAALDIDGDGDIDNDDLINGEVPSGIQDPQILSRPEILMCLTGDCTDRKISSGSSGSLFEKSESSDRALRGRQSWRQVR